MTHCWPSKGQWEYRGKWDAGKTCTFGSRNNCSAEVIKKDEKTPSQVKTQLPLLNAIQDPLIIKNVSNLITLDAHHDNLDDEIKIVGNNFQDRARQQPTYHHYLEEANKLGCLRTEFSSLAKLIRSDIEEAANCP